MTDSLHQQLSQLLEVGEATKKEVHSVATAVAVLNERLDNNLPRLAEAIKGNTERIRGVEAITASSDILSLKHRQAATDDTIRSQAEELSKLKPLVARVKDQGDQIHALRRKVEWAKGWAAGAAIAGGLLGGLLMKLLLGS